MTTYYCDRCGSFVAVPVPVEPVYSLLISALLVPLSLGALKRALVRHKAKLKPALYRWDGLRRVRYLYASDVVTLRGLYFTEELHPRKAQP